MSKAAAQRWLAGMVGREIDTVQVRPDGITWRPGPRTLARDGNVFTLNGSRLTFTLSHVVTEIGDNGFTVEWQDEDGVQIHMTTYTGIGV